MSKKPKSDDAVQQAAHDLLDALTHLLNVLDGEGDRRGVLVNLPGAIERARAAVAKAKGGNS